MAEPATPPASDRRSTGWILLVLPVALVLGAVLVTARRSPEVESTPVSAAPDSTHGRRLAEQVCGGCHLFPEPAVASRYDWAFGILPSKFPWVGLAPMDLRQHPGGDRVLARKVFPTAPIVSRQDWMTISSFYLAQAPLQLATDLPPPAGSRVRFQSREIPYPREPDIGATAIDTDSGVVYVGNAAENMLDVLSVKGEVLASQLLGRPVTFIAQSRDAVLVTSIGTLAPSDLPGGELTVFSKPDAAQPRRQTIARELMRPGHVSMADANGDGRPDFLLTETGHYLGRVSAMLSRGPSEYVLVELLDRAGGVCSHWLDLDGDGSLEAVTLMGGAREGLYVSELRAADNFTTRAIAETHPAWDSTWFEAADFDADGHLDLVLSNGGQPAGARPLSGPRTYHGVHFFRGDGTGGFKRQDFIPLAGAWRLAVGDFNLDQRPDIVVAVNSPSRNADLGPGLLLLENLGDMKFHVGSIPGSAGAPWSTVSVGDIDQDGDPDILAGASKRRLGAGGPWLRRAWERKPAALRLFINELTPQ